MRGWFWLAWLLVLPAVGAQSEPTQPEACRAPVLEVEDPPRPFTPGTSRALLMVIENPNNAPIESVRALITTTAPAGWTAVPAQRELTLGPHNVSLTALAVTAPNRGSGAGEGNISIIVTFRCSNDILETRASTTHVVVVNMTAFNAPWPLVVGAFLLLAVGVTILGVRRLRRGIAIRAQGASERAVLPGRSVKFTFVVENRRGRPQRLRLASEGVPEGWTLHLALESLELEPGEEKALWALLKAPITALPGTEVQIVLHLEDAAGARDIGSTMLATKVESLP